MVTTEPPPAASINGSAARAHATSEYALTSSAIQKRSRGISVKRPSRSSAAAKATECTSRSSLPSNTSDTWPNTLSIAASSRTSSSVTSGLDTDSASSRTFFSIRSPSDVNAKVAPPSARRRAIAQAIDRLLATPRISAFLPSSTRAMLTRLSGTLRNLASPTVVVGSHLPGCGDVGFGCAHTDPPRHERIRAAARPRREHPHPHGSRARLDPGHRAALPAAARCVERRPQPFFGDAVAAAEPSLRELAGLPLAARAGPECGCRAGARSDPECPDRGALLDSARRLRRAAAGQDAVEAG